MKGKAMADYPIIFKGELVRAILDGRKTQTRRVIRPQPGDDLMLPSYVPYGEVGDRLWVRERFQNVGAYKPRRAEICYYADGGLCVHDIPDTHRDMPTSRVSTRWSPSIFMPRWASRISLEITSLAVERVQEISDEDCYAEGLDAAEYDDAEQMSGAGVRIAAGSSERHWFSCLWDSINAKRGYSWESNPYVWKIGFKLLKDKEGEDNDG